MRILFSTFGSLGDLHPYLAIALEAKKRGHEPILATSPKYRAKIENLGLGFRAVRPDLPADVDFAPLAKRVMDMHDGPRYLFQEILAPSLRDTYADSLEAAADCDLLISHPTTLVAPLVAQKLGKKWLFSAIAPISLWSRLDPTVPPTHPHLDFLRALGPMWPKFFIAAGRAATKSWVAEVETLRREIGIASLGHPLFEGQFSPFGNLALFSRHFAAPQTDWPTNTTATGYCIYDAEGYEVNATASSDGNSGTIGAPDWKTWMQNGAKPIVFTLGSSAVFTAGDFWRKSIQVAQKHGQRAVLLTGKAPRMDDLPASILQLDYAPHSAVFPLAGLLVHQGGAGTTAQALRAGVPQIIMPFAHDQPDHARRIEKLGLGFKESRRTYPGRAFDAFFAAPQSYRAAARELGEKIRAENGPQTACEAMEKFDS